MFQLKLKVEDVEDVEDKVYSISHFIFLPALPLSWLPSPQPCTHVHHLSEPYPLSENSTAEALFNRLGGGKLNKALKEKYLPLPFHLNLRLLAVLLLSAATHWEA